jgi:transcriptional regulator with XRE-family HTH domain
MQLSMSQLAKTLGLAITNSAIEKWEKNQNRSTDKHRKRPVEFLGFNPVRPTPTSAPAALRCIESRSAKLRFKSFHLASRRPG